MRGTAFGRVNLIGEHTDYNDGLVLPMPIPLGVTVTATPRDDREVHVRSVGIGESARYSLGEEERRGHWSDYVMGCTSTLAKLLGIEFAHGFDLVIESTLPMGAGLASSAALTTAVVRAVTEAIDPPLLASVTHMVETGFVGLPCGTMDNVCAAYGTVGQAVMIDCRSGERRRVPLPPATSIVVAHSGVTHANASSGYAKRREECREACALLGVTSLREAQAIGSLPDVLRRRARHVVTENARVLATVDALEAGDSERAGNLFDESHISMRDDYEVSVPEVDRLVEALRAEPGVYGARMTGGGFGGCVIALIRKDAKNAVESAVSRCPGARSIPLG